MNKATRAQMAAMRNLGIPVDLDHPPTFDEAVKAIRNPPDPAPTSAEGGALIGDGSDGAYTFGPLPTERTINVCTPHVATLPDGSRVELPAGTVLREGT